MADNKPLNARDAPLPTETKSGQEAEAASISPALIFTLSPSDLPQ